MEDRLGNQLFYAIERPVLDCTSTLRVTLVDRVTESVYRLLGSYMIPKKGP